MSDPTHIVPNALIGVMQDLWREKHGPYRNPSSYSSEFTKFCEDKFKALFKNDALDRIAQLDEEMGL